jgi:large subunit ribosomal protein L29
MKASDLREKSVDDLRELQKSIARDVFQNRLKNFTNRLDDTSAVRKAKRDLARIVTVLQEQALGIVRTARPAGSESVTEAATAVSGEAGAAKAKPASAKKAAPKAKVEAKSAAPAEAKPKKTAAKKSSAKADKKGEAK